jgi:hypothetical protein
VTALIVLAGIVALSVLAILIGPDTRDSHYSLHPSWEKDHHRWWGGRRLS